MRVVRFPTFSPRDYQRPSLEAFFYQQYRKFYFLEHRRAGKDLKCWNMTLGAACKRVGLYFYLLPQTNQARKVIWNGMDGSGKRFLDYMPQELIARVNNMDMSLTLHNGSLIQLTGSNNYNALMGSNPVGIVYSEYALQDPRARQYLSPILAENGGWEIINTTPRGKNHAYHVYQQSMASPNEWFSQRLTVDDTYKLDGSRVITLEDIESERRGGMSDELIRQEFYCDFNVGIVGAYYTQEIDRAEREGRITHFNINKDLPVYTSWDLGISDATSIWWFQPNGQYIDVIYHYQNTNVGIEHYIEKIADVKRMFGIRYSDHFAPHDISKRDLMTPQTRQSIARDKGIHFNRVQRTTDVDQDIQSVKTMFEKFRFHVKHTRSGLDCLREYRRKYDDANKVFLSKPLHDWTSDSADAFRCFCAAWQELYTRPKHLNKPFKYQMPGV